MTELPSGHEKMHLTRENVVRTTTLVGLTGQSSNRIDATPRELEVYEVTES